MCAEHELSVHGTADVLVALSTSIVELMVSMSSMHWASGHSKHVHGQVSSSVNSSSALVYSTGQVIAPE